MSLPRAFAIHEILVTLEFPSTIATATIFALFKTYGIPSISSLLVKTKQLNGPPLVRTKRYADTGALLLEAVLQEPGSKRSVEAIARINYLHDRHRSKGAISDEDMLFTLSLFALEPMRWVQKHEWRELDDMEVCAIGTHWKYLGDALKVPYELLPGYKTGWKDALEWMAELDDWSRAYEVRFMVPAKSSQEVAEATLEVVLYKMPKSLHGLARNIYAAAMETRLREAMLISPLPPIYMRTFSIICVIRKFTLRHLSLPRFIPLTRIPTPSPTNPDRIHLPRARVYPWYIRPTFNNRWGPMALIARFRGEMLPGDDARFMSGGFCTMELGPFGLMGHGLDEQEVEVKRMKGIADEGRGCPFFVGL
ncbi:MAG: hypothetical protein Q9209_000863 [Squamulea sp. 1 TL-2023]